MTSPSIKKTALTVLQVTITVTILWVVFHDPKKRGEMIEAIYHAKGAWLLIGLGVYGIVEVIAGIRWQMLLRVQGIELGWLRVFMLLMIGMFFNFFVPGGTGGDVVKVFYLLKETPGRRPAALLSVLMDRIVGLISLMLAAGIFITMRWSWLMSTATTANYVWIALAILGGSLLSIVASFVLTGCGLIHKLPARMPFRDKAAELALAYNLYGRAWRPTILAVALSIGSHFGYFATFFCAAKALDAPGLRIPTLVDLCTVMPIVNTIVAMPISFGGIGVREKLFETFLGNLAGVHEAVAVVISSTGYLLTLCWGLLGGVFYIFYRPTEHAKLRDITAEIAALEHSVAEEERALEIAHKEHR